METSSVSKGGCSANPKAAMNVFMEKDAKDKSKMFDPSGYEMALGTMAQRFGMPADSLRPLVEKYV